eukprot:21139_5
MQLRRLQRLRRDCTPCSPTCLRQQACAVGRGTREFVFDGSKGYKLSLPFFISSQRLGIHLFDFCASAQKMNLV